MVKSKELKLMRKALEKAEKVRNPLELVAAADKNFDDGSSSSSSSFTLQYASAQDLLASNKDDKNADDTSLQQCLDLFEANMSDLYGDSSWGLDMDKKRSEFTHKKARYLLVTTAAAATTTTAASSLAAFVQFRFDYDDEDDPSETVLYVYEIQVADGYRRQGLGRRLMKVVEQIAHAMGLPKIMLTVFKRNKEALQFYRDKLRYEIDACSPSQHGASEDYEILSKQL